MIADDELGLPVAPFIIAPLAALAGPAIIAAVNSYGALKDPGESEFGRQLLFFRQQVGQRWAFRVTQYPKSDVISVLSRLQSTAANLASRAVAVRSELSAAWAEQVTPFEKRVQKWIPRFSEKLARVQGVPTTMVPESVMGDLRDDVNTFIIDARALIANLDYCTANDAFSGGWGRVLSIFVQFCDVMVDLFNALGDFLIAMLQAIVNLLGVLPNIIRALTSPLTIALYIAAGLGTIYLGYRVVNRVRYGPRPQRQRRLNP